MSSSRTPLSDRILLLLKRIPKGKVATYGQIAALAGNPRAARQVARLLHSLSEKEGISWHRVINRLGRISLNMDEGGDLQRRLLLKEKVRVSERGTVNLDEFGWDPK